MSQYYNQNFPNRPYNPGQRYFNEPVFVPEIIRQPEHCGNVRDSQDDHTITPIQSKLLKFFSEFFGTLLLVFMTCMGCTMQFQLSTLQVSMSSGLVVMAIVHTFGPISGAHINPVVTIAHFIMVDQQLPELFIYFVAQFLGAITGYGILMAVSPNMYYDFDGHCMTLPSSELTHGQAVAVEFLLTFVLILAVCASWDKRNKDSQDSVSLRIGLLVVLLSIIGGPFTGASMNPVRSLGPAVWKMYMDLQWIYILGPLAGSIVASVFYKFILMKR